MLEPCLNQSSYSYYGHDYALVSIGNQCWFQENLRSTQYANGDAIPQIQDEAEWNNTGQGAYSVYDGDTALASVYGLLYNWTVTADPRGACPTGWSVASEGEWNELISTVGGTTVAGGALKEAGTTHWSSPNTGATNSSGFTALPAGERSYGSAGFNGLGTDAYFWTSSSSGGAARSVRLVHNDEAMTISSISSQRGQSIRCLRNPAAFGCTDINYLEYDPDANVDDGGCATPSIPGCTISGYMEYNPQANVNDGSCQTLQGCTDTTTVSFAGYDYSVVAIGTQCWFQQNLRTMEYRNGDAVPVIVDPVEWENTYSGALSNYNNDELLALDSIGRLYNGFAVQDPRGLCPVGWHVPTDNEWMELETFVGMPLLERENTGWRGTQQNVGVALKSAYWSGNGFTGFEAVPAGYRNTSGYFSQFGNGTLFWSGVALGRFLDGGQPGIYRSNYQSRWGASIRCLRSVTGCTEPEACNYDPEANEEDGSCEYLSCAYCNVESACNYEPAGLFLNNASCVFPVYGYDCNGDCLPEFLVDGECSVNIEDCPEATLTMAINPILDGGGSQAYTFGAAGQVGLINITSTWTANASSWPGDMGFALVSPDGVAFGDDGYNVSMSSVGYSLNETQSLPGDWNTTASGVYSVEFDPELPLSGDGTWQLVILNGYTGSSTIVYDLLFEIEGLCGQ